LVRLLSDDPARREVLRGLAPGTRPTIENMVDPNDPQVVRAIIQ
jgi:hypothetical protein